MKIGIQTWGSDGDINPCIALAAGLAAAGHQVTLAVTSAERKDYRPFGQRLGFHLIQVGYIGNTEAELHRIASQLFTSSNLFKQTQIIFAEMFEPGVDAMYEAAKSLCATNDLLIGHFILHPLHTAAEKLAKPYLTVTLNHSALPTREVPPPSLPNFGGWFNWLLWVVFEKTLNRFMLPLINRLRIQERLPPVTSFRKVWESPLANLIAVSPIFAPPRRDWGANQQVGGFFRLPEQARPWEMPKNLSHFLAEGPRPVYLTFGSMLGIDQEYVTKTTQLLVETAQLAGCRAIIQSHWPSIVGIPEADNIYRVTQVPHTRLFPHCAAVVHHGGAGTTHTSLLSGCPSVVVAHIADQFFWGNQLKRLGVAPKLLNRRSVTAKQIAYELTRVLNNSEMSGRAKQLGQQLSGEDGVSTAVKIIGSL